MFVLDRHGEKRPSSLGRALGAPLAAARQPDFLIARRGSRACIIWAADCIYFGVLHMTFPPLLDVPSILFGNENDSHGLMTRPVPFRVLSYLVGGGLAGCIIRDLRGVNRASMTSVDLHHDRPAGSRASHLEALRASSL